MAMAVTRETLSASDHSAQLRKAVVASTIGTAIEWYDFFLYGTAAGLVFGKLYFPNEDALTATLAAFGTYFIGFVGRPIGAAIFGHYGDRIGRKATLIATLLIMGIATFLIAFVPTYASIGIWGAVISLCCGRFRGSVSAASGRIGAPGDGMVAHARSTRSGGILAAIRRAVRSVSGEPCSPRIQPMVR
jgi:MFS family permease